jgi:hypothetical protein
MRVALLVARLAWGMTFYPPPGRRHDRKCRDVTPYFEGQGGMEDEAKYIIPQAPKIRESSRIIAHYSLRGFPTLRLLSSSITSLLSIIS